MEQPGLHRGYLVDTLSAIVIGLALILGGRERTVAVAWRTLNDSGGPLLWGSVFIAMAGVLIVATFISHRAMMVALWGAAVPYALLGYWFLDVAAFHEPSASFVGGLLCARAAIMHISRATAYWEAR